MYSNVLPKVRLIYPIVFILVTFTFPVTIFTFGCVSFDRCGPCVRVQPASRGRCRRVGWCCGAPTLLPAGRGRGEAPPLLFTGLPGCSDRQIIQLGNASTGLTAKTGTEKSNEEPPEPVKVSRGWLLHFNVRLQTKKRFAGHVAAAIGNLFLEFPLVNG